MDGPALWELVRDVQTCKRTELGCSNPAVNGGAPRPPPTPGRAQPTSVPACPKCQSPMVRRTAGKGPNAGLEFWGCSGFPKCRGTRQMGPSTP
ncbi:MAG: topoisomerase DNA-binding C4 zinc finger domain-containing protein [Planctomycetota bacterium]